MAINDRIKELRKHLNLTQTEFGDKIGLKQNTVGQMEGGSRSVTERTILLICEKFNANKVWLLEGHGEMFENDDMEFARAVDRVMFGESDFARRVFKLFGKLSLEEWNKLEEIARALVEDEKKDPQH